MLRRSSRAFWTSSVLSLGVVVAAHAFGWYRVFPELQKLAGGRGLVGGIVDAIVLISLWAVVCLVIRRFGSFFESNAIIVLQDATQGSDLFHASGFAARDQVFAETMTMTRFRALGSVADEKQQADVAQLLDQLSSSDSQSVQTSYGTLRALIWALPTFGFMGTAVEMADAVRGLSQTLGQTSGFEDLRRILATDVVPSLADAFGITLFALASSVVCFFLLSIVAAADESNVIRIDEHATSLLSRTHFRTGQAGFGPDLLVELTKLNDKLGGGGQSLESIEAQLERLNLNLESGQGAVGSGGSGPGGQGALEVLANVAAEVSRALEDGLVISKRQ